MDTCGNMLIYKFTYTGYLHYLYCMYKPYIDIYTHRTAQMRLVSLEVDSVDSFLGRDSARLLRELVTTQAAWARQRAAQMVAVRQVRCTPKDVRPMLPCT